MTVENMVTSSSLTTT